MSITSNPLDLNMTTELPTLPNAPPAAGASSDDVAAWSRSMEHYRGAMDLWRASMDERRIAAAELHAQAQADTAAAMNRGAAALEPKPAEPPAEPPADPGAREAAANEVIRAMGAWLEGQ